MKNIYILGGVVLIVLLVGLFIKFSNSDNLMTNNELNETETEFSLPAEVIIHTNYGQIELTLFAETPITSRNFLDLAQSGFYDGTLFHRIIEGFMIQGGDPLTRDGDPSLFGTGGPGYQIPDEFIADLSNEVGTISMANSGPNTGGSQFFINVANNSFLDGKHAVFGRVIEGMEVVAEIERVETGLGDRPQDPVKIERVEIRS